MSEEQRMVPVWMKVSFIEKISASLEKLGYTDRSRFIRDAIIEKLQRSGVDVDPVIAMAPSRIGKGGRPSHKNKKRVRYPDAPSDPLMLNEEPEISSKNKQIAADIVAATIKKVVGSRASAEAEKSEPNREQSARNPRGSNSLEHSPGPRPKK